MLKRVLAWIALIFFIFIVVNILFIHIYVTESVTIFLLYALVFIFGSKGNLFKTDPMPNRSNDSPEPADNPEVNEKAELDDHPADISEHIESDGSER